jgi:hypothetical protein
MTMVATTNSASATRNPVATRLAQRRIVFPRS